MKTIHSRDNPFFKELLKLSASSRQRRQAGLALLDGAHLLSACLDAGQKPQHILLNQAAQRDDEISSLLARAGDVPVTLLDDALFDRLSELKTATGVIALVAVLPPVQNRDDYHFALLLEDIQDPGNAGSMIRSAAAAGCDAVFLSQGCADAWSPKTLRAGMGGHFALDIHETANLIAVAQNFGGKVYAAAPNAARSLYDCDFTGKTAFVIGNEGAGLSAEILKLCETVSVRMPGKMESLNAAAAAAVCLFEAVRQRQPPLFAKRE